MAALLRTKSFLFEEGNNLYYGSRGGGGGKIGGHFDWWISIQESAKWQQGIYYTLSACYALVSLVALVLFFWVLLVSVLYN